jgi:P-type Ca2+ transporter type 2C
MEWHISKEEVLNKQDTTEDGLSKEEAILRQQQYGSNEITAKKQGFLIKTFLGQFKDPLMYLLIAAGFVSLFVNTQKPLESIAIFTIVMINALLGFFQEYNAEKALAALSKMVAKTTVVVREGKEEQIDAALLVPGDIILLQAGDFVPADARILSQESLKVNESSLTGESSSVNKQDKLLPLDAILAERSNMIFMGTVVSEGSCKAVVISTGNNTEFGRIASSLSKIKQQATPLQQKFAQLAKQITYIAGALIFAVFVIGYFQWHDKVGELLLFALVLAVGTVPSALPLIVTLSLSLGARKLASVKMLLRSLPAAESMGSVDFICTDKTGTLTKNEMTVKRVYINNNTLKVKGSGYDDSEKINDKQEELQLLSNIAINCNNAKVEEQIIGDPMEAALIVLARKAGIVSLFKRKKEFPFDSVRKRMSVLTEKGDIYVKGAVESLLNVCSHIQINEKARKLTAKDKSQILKIQDDYAKDALRVLGFAYRHGKATSLEEAEKDLTFVGMVGMQDPPRDEATQAIKQAKSAGISVMMITGDHIMTAKTIAQEIGILEKGKLCVEGKELEHYTDEHLSKCIEDISVVARATPQLKLRIVNALQSRGRIVAMTGDGVNDAPALKKADVGLSMGITGTDVAKEASNAILMDDNFATIVNAIREGRTIYDKIIKSAKYLLSCNFGEIITVLGSLVFFRQIPLQPLQILMINMLTDSAPAAGLGTEQSESDVMKRLPRDPKEKPITKNKFIMIAIFGIIMGGITVFMFGRYLHLGLGIAQTVAFTTLVIMQLFAVMSMRSFRPGLRNLNLFTNRALFAGILFSVILQLLAIYLPFMQHLLGTVPLMLSQWMWIILAGIVSYALFEIGKLITPNV